MDLVIMGNILNTFYSFIVANWPVILLVLNLSFQYGVKITDALIKAKNLPSAPSDS